MSGGFHNHILEGGGATLPCRAEMPGFFHTTTKEVNITMADEKTIAGHEERRSPTGMSSQKSSPILGVDKSLEPFGIENLTPPVADDKKGKADPGNEAPITEPKFKGVKVIDITGQVTHRSDPSVPGDGGELVNDTKGENVSWHTLTPNGQGRPEAG